MGAELHPKSYHNLHRSECWPVVPFTPEGREPESKIFAQPKYKFKKEEERPMVSKAGKYESVLQMSTKIIEPWNYIFKSRSSRVLPQIFYKISIYFNFDGEGYWWSDRLTAAKIFVMYH